jgi:ComF family protein
VDPRALLDLLLPTTCVVCAVPGAVVCTGCAARLMPAGPLGPSPVEVREAFLYEGVGADLIVALKDRRRRDLAPALAALAAARLSPPPPGSVLVPVPGEPGRVRRRGFDHGDLIARALGRLWDARVARPLRRSPGGPTQRGAPRAVRLAQMHGAIAVVPGAEVPADIVLVDDVRTTGATLDACARALRAAGARRVQAVCVARAPAVRG